MKIGTISLNINAPDFNYGAVLHSWAFQQYLKKMPFVEKVELIDYTMPSLERQMLKYPLLSAIRCFHPRDFLKYICLYGPYKVRYHKFEHFTETQFDKTEVKYTQNTLNSEKLPYDCVICESDVIWSPGFSGGHFDKSFFLALDSMRHMKRIAYAPSMADGVLTPEQENEISSLLLYVDNISCRESYEKKILEKYTCKPIEHVLDPVLLLDANDYDKITAKRLIQEHYVMVYAPLDNNNEMLKQANAYAEKKGLKVIEISTKLKNLISEQGWCIGTAGVEEFLSAIRYADVVFTNSFHAICFSIIFNVEFYAFSRACAGKVQDICRIFGLENRFFSNDKFEEQLPINYTVVNQHWQKMRAKSVEWLNEAVLMKKAE